MSKSCRLPSQISNPTKISQVLTGSKGTTQSSMRPCPSCLPPPSSSHRCLLLHLQPRSPGVLRQTARSRVTCAHFSIRQRNHHRSRLRCLVASRLSHEDDIIDDARRRLSKLIIRALRFLYQISRPQCSTENTIIDRLL